MRIVDSTIYLVEPVLGFKQLTGTATVGTTWLDYTFAAGVQPPTTGADGRDVVTGPCRVLIPITNITAIVVPSEEEDSGHIGLA